ncbi:MAG: hypothetical protein FRX49_07384 [Trebouxia sp. A1-2]|nr:MAG: hypothetical protein FRX49_07384 [Trebouxia sp. A1-2]
MDVLDQFEGSPDLAPILEQVNQMDTDLLVRRLRMRQHVLQEMKRNRLSVSYSVNIKALLLPNSSVNIKALLSPVMNPS